MGDILELNSVNFEASIQEGVVIVDFWAPWCGPCRMQTPVLEKLSEKVSDEIKITKVNIDAAQDIATKYGIQSIPTIIIFKDGVQVQKMVGLQNENSLSSALEDL